MTKRTKRLETLSEEEQTAKLYQKRSPKKKRRSRPIGTITFGACINEQMPTKYYGFIYSITFSDGSWYIGQKSFEKGEAWQSYKSSSKIVKERLKTEQATFKVLFHCQTKGELSYVETRELFSRNALEDPRSLNENIAGRYFRKNVQRYSTASYTG